MLASSWQAGSCIVALRASSVGDLVTRVRMECHEMHDRVSTSSIRRCLGTANSTNPFGCGAGHSNNGVLYLDFLSARVFPDRRETPCCPSTRSQSSTMLPPPKQGK